MKYTSEELKTKVGYAKESEVITMLKEDNIDITKLQPMIDRWEEYSNYLQTNGKKYNEVGEADYEERASEFDSIRMALLKIIDIYY